MMNSILGLTKASRDEINKRGLIIFLACLNYLLCYAQYIEIPTRLDTCTNCHGTSVNPNYCRVCNGTGRNKAWSEKNKYHQSIHCRACAGGKPYICRQCKNGLSPVVDGCFKEQKKYIPLWDRFGLIEDIYFIGNAEIDNSFVIFNHRIKSIKRGSLENQNLEYTSVTYNKENYKEKCMARTAAMLGMLDYENVFVLETGLFLIDSIKTGYTPEPRMQKMLNNGKVNTKRNSYKVHYKNDSTFLKYIVTPNHIVCGHEEFYFKEGILVKKVSHKEEFIYKYLKFDTRNNWIERVEISKSRGQVIRQKRSIKYL